MSFVLSKVLWFVFQPTNLLLLLVLVLSWCAFLRHRSAPTLLLAVTGSGLFLAALLPVGLWLALPLEERFARPDAPPERVDGIVVLGGAQTPSVTAARGVLAVNGRAERLIEGVALARRYPQAKLVFSGGSGVLIGGRGNEADVNRLYVALAGLDPDRPLYENRSRNTYENAVFSADLVAPEAGEVWLLVTSASHMPRSMGIFEEIGWDVVPWPVDYSTTGGPEMPPSFEFAEELDRLDQAVKEYIGLAAYRLMGRTSALFPGPPLSE